MSLAEQQWHLFELDLDRIWAETCPACGAQAFLGGDLFSEKVSEQTDPEEPWEEYVERTYLSEEFNCPTCKLSLVGRNTIEVAGLPTEDYETEVREREYEQDYGND